MLESNRTKRDAYKAYHNVLIPKIGYTFATTTMTEKELNGMQVIVDKVHFQKQHHSDSATYTHLLRCKGVLDVDNTPPPAAILILVPGPGSIW